MKSRKLRVWLEDPAPPLSHTDYKAGRWVAEESWPSPRLAEPPLAAERGLLRRGRLGKKNRRGTAHRLAQTVGLTAASWCPYGVGHDSRSTSGRRRAAPSLRYGAHWRRNRRCCGRAGVELDVSADRPNALLACTLSEILPGGAVSR